VNVARIIVKLSEIFHPCPCSQSVLEHNVTWFMIFEENFRSPCFHATPFFFTVIVAHNWRRGSAEIWTEISSNPEPVSRSCRLSRRWCCSSRTVTARGNTLLLQVTTVVRRPQFKLDHKYKFAFDLYFSHVVVASGVF